MKVLSEPAEGWNVEGIQDVRTYDNCMQSACTGSGCEPVLVCGCVTKEC